MATVTRVVLTCDVYGHAKDVKTWAFRDVTGWEAGR